MSSIEDRIKKAGISYRSLSEQTNIDRRLLAKRAKEPELLTVKNLEVISKALGVSDETLFNQIIKGE